MPAASPAKDNGSPRIDSIYQALFRAILAQDLLPGTKLSEEIIGAHFSASRTIVRAALNRLHTEALVEFKQNRGAFVASPGIEEARQVFEARHCIERVVIARLAETASDPQLEALADHIGKERQASSNEDEPGSILLSGEFHLLAARMAGNAVFTGFLKSLISRTSLILAQHGRHEETDCSVDEHLAVLEALRTRDPAIAEAAIATHLQHVVARANLLDPKRPLRGLREVLAQYS
jgi:DNA-binding GntR family transcriptional regulator